MAVLYQQVTCLVLLTLLAVITVHGAMRHAEEPYYTQSRTAMFKASFPGGSYVSSSTANFPAATSIAGAVLELKPGGLREPHWHDPVEWAYVLAGTCRVTLTDFGFTHPVESWDFAEGDVWYFPSNVGHAILGLEHGCSYVAAYNQGDFDELRDARGLSGWLSSTPLPILAQALGASEKELQQQIAPDLDNFMPLGDLKALTADQGSPPLLAALASAYGKAGQLQSTILSHRFPLASGLLPEVENLPDGGSIKMVDVTTFPISEKLAGALVYQGPYSLRQMHWHATADEWQYLINGTLEIGIMTSTGHVSTNTLYAGDVGFVPKGAGHWIKNPTADPGFLVLTFSQGKFTNIDIQGFVGNFPSEYLALALKTSTETVEKWDVLGAKGILEEHRGNYTQIKPSGRQWK